MSARIWGRISLAVAPVADLAAADDHDLIRQGNDTLLVGDDDHGGPALVVDLLEGLRQPGEAPEVDAGLGLVKDHELGVPGQEGRDLDALDLAAGEGDVHLPVEIIVGAEAHPGQVLAALVLAERIIAAGQGQQALHRDALEAGGLLEAVADAEPRPLGDGEIRDVLSVPKDLAGGGLDQAHDDLGQGGLAAAVGASEDHELMVRHRQGDALQNIQRTALILDGIADVLQFQHGV